MFLVYCLPTEPMRQNVIASSYLLESEDDSFFWASWLSGTQLDGYTDSIMLNNAVFPGTGSTMMDAMNNPRIFYDDLTSQTQILLRALYGSVEGETVNYARYWHGYLIWLKPLLCIFTFSDIRVMNMYFQLILAFCVLLEVYKLSGFKATVPFGLALLLFNPVSTALCFQYTSIYVLTLMSALVMMKFRLFESGKYWQLFVWLGIATAFFDFLTYPVAALGISLLLLLYFSHDALSVKFRKIFACSFAWAFAYGGMWCGKWFVASLLTRNNTLSDGLNSVRFRTIGDTAYEVGLDYASPFSVIGRNILQFKNYPLILLIFICLLVISYLIVFRKYRFKVNCSDILPMLFVSLYPFVWYYAVRNHSAVHSWMTHRNLIVSFLAVFFIIFKSLFSPSEIDAN